MPLELITQDDIHKVRAGIFHLLKYRVDATSRPATEGEARIIHELTRSFVMLEAIK